jgi:uncharacterized OB-fold protein
MQRGRSEVTVNDHDSGSGQHLDLRPPPAPDEISGFFWEGAAAGRLLLQRCMACRRYQYPPDVVCTHCQHELLEPAQMSGGATLYTYAVVQRAFHPGFVDHLPYVVAMVELDEQPGLMMYTNVVGADPQSLAVGMRLEVDFEQRVGVTLPQFRPVPAVAR